MPHDPNRPDLLPVDDEPVAADVPPAQHDQLTPAVDDDEERIEAENDLA